MLNSTGHFKDQTAEVFSMH